MSGAAPCSTSQLRTLLLLSSECCVYVKCWNVSIFCDCYLNKLLAAQNSVVLLHCYCVSGDSNKQLLRFHVFTLTYIYNYFAQGGGIHSSLVKESKITKKPVSYGQNLAIRIHTENIPIIQGIRR